MIERTRDSRCLVVGPQSTDALTQVPGSLQPFSQRVRVAGSNEIRQTPQTFPILLQSSYHLLAVRQKDIPPHYGIAGGDPADIVEAASSELQADIGSYLLAKLRHQRIRQCVR